MVQPLQPSATPTARQPLLDLARGVALIAMVVFHTGWDLSFLGLAFPGLRANAAWQVFGHAIAGSFLTLAGASLVMARARGQDSLGFLRRLGMVAGGALLVSMVTYFAMPGQFIFFGILHLIALGSVLGLAFLSLPPALVLAAAGAVFALPPFVASAALSAPWLVWLGLGDEVPPSTDFVPLFPWFGFILLGIGLAGALRLAQRAPMATGVLRPVQAAGRRSLVIYLVHQPLIFGGLWLLAQGLSPAQDKDMRDFLAACGTECRASGGEAGRCLAICQCAAQRLKDEKLWSDVIANRITEEARTRMAGIGRDCAASPAPR